MLLRKVEGKTKKKSEKSERERERETEREKGGWEKRGVSRSVRVGVVVKNLCHKNKAQGARG